MITKLQTNDMHWRLSEKDYEALMTIQLYWQEGQYTKVLLLTHLKVSDDQANRYLRKFRRLGLIRMEARLSRISTHNDYKMCYRLTSLGEKLTACLTDVNKNAIKNPDKSEVG